MKYFYFFVIFILFTACSKPQKQDKSVLIHYSYRKTILVVNIVQKAAEILESKGLDALKKFNNSLDYPEFYLYVYGVKDAYCYYHGADSTKIGKSISDQIDYLGKPIHHLIVNALQDDDNPDNWIHYNWPRPHDIFPTWKSACHKKVTLKNGVEVYVGAGIYGKISESEFIRISVDNAVELINRKDTAAVEIFKSPQSAFTFFDSFIFIYDTEGKAIIDPTYKDGSNLNLRDFRDASNHKPFDNLVKNLEKEDYAWGQIQYKDPSSMNLRKRIIYARKTKLNNIDVIVGSMIESPKSVWFN